MNTLQTELESPQLISERGQWFVPVPWDAGDDLRLALGRLGYSSTLCLNPETREARLELWPDVNPAEFLAALDQLRARPTTPQARPAVAGVGPAGPGPTNVPAAQRA